MGMPVVSVASGGRAVVDVTATKPNLGLRVSEAASGFGRPVTRVTNGIGLPVTFVNADGSLSTAAQRVVNGNFSLNPINAAPLTVQNGWQWNRAATSTITWDGSQVTLVSDGTRINLISAPITGLIVGRSYRIEADLSNGAIGQFGTSINASAAVGLNGSVIGGVSYPSGHMSVVGVASATTMFLLFGRTAASTPRVDNVSLWGPL